MDAAHAQVADVHGRVFEGLELHAETHLDPVRRLVVLGEANDNRIAEESACGKEAVRTSERDRIRVSAAVQQIGKRLVGDKWRAGESEQARGGVLIVFLVFTPGERTDGSTARRYLAPH